MTRSGARAASLLFALGSALGGAASASAQTILYLNSQSGDWVGRGQQVTYTDADGVFTATAWSDHHVYISFHTPNYSHFWGLQFATPQGSPISIGGYSPAMRAAAHSPVGNGLDVAGDGRGCYMPGGGRFVVREASIDSAGRVLAFAADFEQHCENMTPALFGAIRYNSAVPLDAVVAVGSARVVEDDPFRPAARFDIFLSAPPSGPVLVDFATQDGTAVAGSDYGAIAGSASLGPTQLGQTFTVPLLGDAIPEATETFEFVLSAADGAPLMGVPGVGRILDDDTGRYSLLLNSQPGDWVGQGRLWWMTAADGVFTPFSVIENGAGVFVETETWWIARFAAAHFDPLVPGSYEGATSESLTHYFPPTQSPGLDVSGDGRGCDVTGRFVVLEASYLDGVPERFAANFEQRCHGTDPALYGAIRFNSLAGPSADLATTLAVEGSLTPVPSVTAVMVVTNNGPDAVAGAKPSLTTSTPLLDVSWTCIGSDGTSCPASGVGALPSLNMPIRGTATLTIHGTSPAPVAVNVTASVAPPPGTLEWNPANDVALSRVTFLQP